MSELLMLFSFIYLLYWLSGAVMFTLCRMDQPVCGRVARKLWNARIDSIAVLSAVFDLLTRFRPEE